MEDDPVRSGSEEGTTRRATRAMAGAALHGDGTACQAGPVGRTRPVSVGDRAVASIGGHSRISAPMLMVWPMGNPKYSTGFAELWAMVKNRRFCQPGMVGRVERATVILDRK